MNDSHRFVFLIEKVPVRFYRGLAEEPTVRTLRRQEAEAQQLGLALGIDEADGLVFRLQSRPVYRQRRTCGLPRFARRGGLFGVCLAGSA